MDQDTRPHTLCQKNVTTCPRVGPDHCKCIMCVKYVSESWNLWIFEKNFKEKVGKYPSSSAASPVGLLKKSTLFRVSSSVYIRQWILSHPFTCFPIQPSLISFREGKWFHKCRKHFVAWLRFQTHWIIYHSLERPFYFFSSSASSSFHEKLHRGQQRNIELIRSVTDAWAAKSWWRWVPPLWSAKPRA